MDDRPRVSVVVPAYNRADVLGRAIDSALAQTVADIEVVVVDDGSSDDTAAVVTSYEDPRVRLLTHERNRGVSAARNTGVEAARGEYVAFLDSDDEWLPRKLDRQLTELAGRGPEWVGAYCDVATAGLSVPARLAATVSKRLFRAGSPTEGGRELAASILALRVFMGPGSTLLVERDAVTAAGGFDEGLSVYEDWDLVLRVLSNGKLAYVDEPLAVTHFTGAVAPSVAAGNDRRFLDRNRHLVADLEREGVPVRRVHRMGLAGQFLVAGEFTAAAGYLDAGAATRPKDLARLVFWTTVGVLTRLDRVRR